MFRFSRIVLALLLVAVAWQTGPQILDLLAYALPSFGPVLTFLTPDLSGHTSEFWLKFVLSLVVFWFLFKVMGVTFGFMAPKAQQFGTTKLVRRFQGFCAELVILGGFFIGLTFLSALDKPEPQPVAHQPVDCFQNPFQDGCPTPASKKIEKHASGDDVVGDAPPPVKDQKSNDTPFDTDNPSIRPRH